jgi:hypothetical protein
LTGYIGAVNLFNQAIEAPVPPGTLALTEVIPLVLTALTVLPRPFRTERTRFWGAFALGILAPTVITIRWVPFNNFLSATDTVLVFIGHALAPLALLTVADIAIARHTTGGRMGGVPQFALPLAVWVVGFYFAPWMSASFMVFTLIVIVLLFALLSSTPGRNLFDRFGLVIGIGAGVLLVALYLLPSTPPDEPLASLLGGLGLPVATLVLVRWFTVRRAAHRTQPHIRTRDFLR